SLSQPDPRGRRDDGPVRRGQGRLVCGSGRRVGASHERSRPGDGRGAAGEAGERRNACDARHACDAWDAGDAWNDEQRMTAPEYAADLRFYLNGQAVTLTDVSPRTLLVDYLRSAEVGLDRKSVV